MSMFNKKINIEANKKYDATGVSSEGITAEERAAIEKKNNKLIEVFKAYDRGGDGTINKLDLAYAMDGFSRTADKDGDGKLSKKELEAYAEQFNKEHNLEGEKAVKGKDLKVFLKEINKVTKGDQKLSAENLVENDKKLTQVREQAKAEAKAEADRARKAQIAADARAAEALAAIEDAQQAEKQAKLKDLHTPKNYTVQTNERLEDILVRSLKNQGIEPTSENLAKAKAEFIENNPKALHGAKGKEYLYAGDVIKVAGNLEDKANADEVKSNYKQMQADKAKAEAEAKAKAEAEAKAKAETEAKEQARHDAGAVPYPAKEGTKSAVPTFELPKFGPEAPDVKVPFAPPDTKSDKPVEEAPPLTDAEKAKKAASEKIARLNKALDDISPSSDYKISGVKVNNMGKEKMTRENKELLEEIAKGDNPGFAARALLAASKGTGTNDVLFEAVLNAGKDAAYFESIDKVLKKQGTTVFALAREEFMGSSGRTGSKNKAYKEYYDARIVKTPPSEAKKLGYKYYGGTSTYIDENNNKFNWNNKTLEFEPVKS